MVDLKRIGKREVEALGPGQIVWDKAVVGFGARRQNSAAITYVLKYRTGDGRQRWESIGRHGSPWTPETARKHAQVLLGAVATGGDPTADRVAKAKAVTVADLCSLYMADVEAGRLLTKSQAPKRPSTILNDRGRIEHHIVPLLGKLMVRSVTRSDVETFLHRVAEGETAGVTKTKSRGVARVTGGRTAATRTVGLLGAVFSYGIRRGHCADNPTSHVTVFADRKRMRRLSNEEYGVMAKALDRAAGRGMWPPAIAAMRFILLTGWRSGEVIGLRWDEIDLDRRTATLRQTKSGRSVRPLCEEACVLIRSSNHLGELVFPASRGPGLMTGFRKFWMKLTLPSDITPHVLRHSYASQAADLGYSESTIAALIGHARHSVTSRYVHSADAVLLAAADEIAAAILTLLQKREV